MAEAFSAIGERQARRVGIDPAGPVSPIENHDQAYYIWRGAGVKQRVLVHVDAHHDMWWMKPQTVFSIANFICPALKEDLVREVIWVVPDATFESAKSRKPLLRHLNRILREYPAGSAPVFEDRRITASVMGKKLAICTLGSMPAVKESVLLDIDTDYLIIPRVAYGESDRHGALPWLWPEELVRKLRGLESDLVTVVYSVEGGYTPLGWKHLGDEIALRLENPAGGDPRLQAMDCMREASEAEARGDTVVAERQYRKAMEWMPVSAAPPYRLARLLARAGRLEEGRRFYSQAVELDSTYRGAYSSAGFHSYWRGNIDAAAQEFSAIRALDPADANAQLGLGLIARKRKLWPEAEQYLRGAVAGDACLIDAQRALGEVLARQGKRQDAIAAYERAARLGLMGHKPLSGPIRTRTREDQILDPWHCAVHLRLARLYEQTGSLGKAVNAIRLGIAGGVGSGVAMRLRLVRLYARQRQWRKSLAELWQAVRAIPEDVSRFCAAASLRARRAVEGLIG